MPDCDRAYRRGRCSTNSRIWLPSTVTVVKKAGARPTRHQPHLSGDREAAAGDDGAGGVDHLAQGGGGRPDLLAGHDLLRRRRERVVGRLAAACCGPPGTSRARRPAPRRRRRRSSPGRAGCGRSRVPQHVAHAAHGLDAARLATLLELAAQVARRRRRASWSPSRSRSPRPGSAAPRG